jgi:hypothetical protein
MATKMPKQSPRPGATTPPTPKPAGGKPIAVSHPPTKADGTKPANPGK